MLSAVDELLARLRSPIIVFSLLLSVGCRGFRPCSDDSVCEPGDRCLGVGAEPDAARYCGRGASPDGGTNMPVSCGSLALLGSVSEPALISFGQQVFLDKVGGQVQLVVAGTSDTRLYQVNWTGSSGTLVRDQSNALLNDKVDNVVYFGNNSIIRAKNINSGMQTEIVICSLSGNKWNCIANAIGASYQADTFPASFQGFGFVGNNTGGEINYFELASSMVVNPCSITTGSYSFTGSHTSASAQILAFAVPGVGTPATGQAVLVPEQINVAGCKLKPLDLNNQVGRINTVSSFNDLLIIGGTLPAAGTNPGVFSFKKLDAKNYSLPTQISAICQKFSCSGLPVSALSLHDSLLAVAYEGLDGGKGAVELLQRQNDSWLSVASPIMGTANKNFGRSVSVSGEYVAVGAPGETAAYVYRCM